LSTQQTRASFVAFGFVALLSAVGVLLYQRYTNAPARQVIIQYPPRPCSPFDKVYGRYKVREIGTLCIEKNTKDWIKSILKKNKLWEPHVSRLIKQYARPGTTAIDIGAYIGSHTLLMARTVGPKGRVIAFEPQVKIYQELLVNLQLNQITNTQTHFLALGDKPRRITMSYPNATNEGGIDFGPGGNIVEIRTLDSFRYTNVSLIKIDVEGAENTIARNRPVILIELIGGVKRDQLSPAEKKKLMTTIHFFKSLGYSLGLIGIYDYVALPMESKAHKEQQKLLQKHAGHPPGQPGRPARATKAPITTRPAGKKPASRPAHRGR